MSARPALTGGADELDRAEEESSCGAGDVEVEEGASEHILHEPRRHADAEKVTTRDEGDQHTQHSSRTVHTPLQVRETDS